MILNIIDILINKNITTLIIEVIRPNLPVALPVAKSST